MAFIREYAEASGDPFSLRMPKRYRNRFKGAGRIFTQAAHLVPGLGPAVDFARGYGLMAGDPGKGAKRKSAGAGPKHKAAKKAKNRADKARGVHKPSGSAKRRGKGTPIDWVALGNAAAGAIPVVGGVAQEVLRQVEAQHPADVGVATGTFDPSGAPAVPSVGASHAAVKRALGLGGHHRRMNPANVKALRRGVRRLEGFGKLVKSVVKAYPSLKGVIGMHTGSHTRHTGGHKAGCRCVACQHR